jgi:hypothetical protein
MSFELGPKVLFSERHNGCTNRIDYHLSLFLYVCEAPYHNVIVREEDWESYKNMYSTKVDIIVFFNVLILGWILIITKHFIYLLIYRIMFSTIMVVCIYNVEGFCAWNINMTRNGLAPLFYGMHCG